MRRIVFLALILPLLFAPLGRILAQEAIPLSRPSQTSSGTKIELPTSPLDPLINEWVTEGKLKNEAQKLMNNIQNKAEEGLWDVTGQAQTAAKDEISRQVSKELNDAKQGVQGYVQGVVGEIKKVVSDLIDNIKTFFRNIFNKTTTA